MLKFKLIIVSMFLSFALLGQKPTEGENLFNSKQYVKARAYYEAALKKKPNDPLNNFRFARCCYELKEFEIAVEHFKMSGTKFPTADMYLGELYFKSYRFEESVVAYQTYIATLLPDDPKLPEYHRKLKQAENAGRLISKIEDITIIDSILVDKNDFLRFYKFSSELGSLTQDPFRIKGRRTDRIKFTTQRQDRVIYSDSIQGQMDILTSYKLLDEWSNPASISEVINTPANENYPFLLLDGVTIYFASDGENSIGGYDLFITRFTSATNSYLTPENIGFPFNSIANDYMMVIDEQRKLGWFATDRNQGSGKVMIYNFIPNDTKVIVRSEDKDYLRSVAQLKSYHIIEKAVDKVAKSSEVKLQGHDKQIEFVVNDTIVYTHLSQFKTEDALRLWGEINKLTSEQMSNSIQLDDLRQQYARLEESIERIPIGLKIIELEKNYIDLENRIKTKTKQVQNLELKYIQKK